MSAETPAHGVGVELSVQSVVCYVRVSMSKVTGLVRNSNVAALSNRLWLCNAAKFSDGHLFYRHCVVKNPLY